MALAEQLSQIKGNYTIASKGERLQPPGEPPYVPTQDGIAKLCEPIVSMLHTINCYDVMGNSTHLVVVDIHAPLTVAFMAAHETQASNCVLWDSVKKVFEGIISIKDYIQVLLYCQRHPAEAEAVQKLSVREWRERTQNQSNYSGPPLMISASVDDSLAACLDRMFRHRVHRLPILAEKDELNAFSVVSVLSLPQLNHFMCRTLFAEGLDSSESALLLPPSAQQILLGTSPGMSNAPSAVLGGNSIVGPYASIFDVPLACIPDLGRHRRQPAVLRMESTVEQAFSMLVESHVQAVGIVNDAGVVVDVISRSDVMRMERNGYYDLTQSCREALSFRVGGTVFAIHEDNTVKEVILHFTKGGVKELFIVDPVSDVVTGQLNLVEVLYFLYSGDTGSNNVPVEM